MIKYIFAEFSVWNKVVVKLLPMAVRARIAGQVSGRIGVSWKTITVNYWWCTWYIVDGRTLWANKPKNVGIHL